MSSSSSHHSETRPMQLCFSLKKALNGSLLNFPPGFAVVCTTTGNCHMVALLPPPKLAAVSFPRREGVNVSQRLPRGLTRVTGHPRPQAFCRRVPCAVCCVLSCAVCSRVPYAVCLMLCALVCCVLCSRLPLPSFS